MVSLYIGLEPSPPGRLKWIFDQIRPLNATAPPWLGWRERAKPLEGRAVATHLVVICLWFVACVVIASNSYNTVENPVSNANLPTGDDYSCISNAITNAHP
jgi:hypothetical protein